MNNELLLLTGKDIPFIEAQVNIHQPTIDEISLINEENFFAGCQFLNFSKSSLSEKDKIGLEDKSDFEIFMSMMCSKEKIQYRNSAMMVLALLFPDYQIKVTNTEILLFNENSSTRINALNYDAFKDIVNTMFELKSDLTANQYNPGDARAKKIAEKLAKAKEKVAKEKGINTHKVAIFSRYISILTVALRKDMNTFNHYTVFQLKDEFTRWQKQNAFEMYVKMKLAGAENLDEVDDWMNDIHS